MIAFNWLTGPVNADFFFDLRILSRRSILPSPCNAPLQKIGGANTQFFCGGTQQHTIHLHTLVGGNKATLPVRSIAHAHLPTVAAGLDDARYRGWAWK